MTVEATGGRRYWLIWVAAIPLALWTVVRVFGLESGGLLTSLMWFTPYAAIVALFVAGIAVALRNWAAAVVAAIATACLAGAVLPRAVGTETESVAGHETLTVLSANVELGGADPRALLTLVDRYHPDLLSLQELTPSFARKLRQNGISDQLPHAVLMAQPNGHGGGLYARFPLEALPHQTRFLFRRVPRPRRQRLPRRWRGNREGPRADLDERRGLPLGPDDNRPRPGRPPSRDRQLWSRRPAGQRPSRNPRRAGPAGG